MSSFRRNKLLWQSCAAAFTVLFVGRSWVFLQCHNEIKTNRERLHEENTKLLNTAKLHDYDLKAFTAEEISKLKKYYPEHMKNLSVVMSSIKDRQLIGELECDEAQKKIFSAKNSPC